MPEVVDELNQRLRADLSWKPAPNGGFVADPTPKFWSMWRAGKEHIVSRGVRVTKENGAWKVYWNISEALLKGQPSTVSSPITSNIDIPAPEGLYYKDFQKAAIEFASKRQNVLIADEPGLGKTIETMGLINYCRDIKTVLVICPASMKINWLNEANKWDTTGKTKSIIMPGKPYVDADMVIINYDLLHACYDKLTERYWDLLVLDESHFIKNAKAQRTVRIIGNRVFKGIKARRKLFLTGTPILNRPSELWTTLKVLDPNGLGSNWMKFHVRYCGAFPTIYGWDTDGATNTGELQDRLRSSIMIRREKSQVLKELPRKIRQVIEIMTTKKDELKIIEDEVNAYDTLEKRKADLSALMAEAEKNSVEYKEAVEKLQNLVSVAFSEMSKLRLKAGMLKVPYAIELIENILEETDKLVVFAHHHDVISKLKETFGDKAVLFTGRENATQRDEAVTKFQTDPDIKLFVGSIHAAGVGLTLTAASRVLFVEQDWTPSILTQCEDRVHRIGQEDTVLIQHLVMTNSLDARMMKMVVEKQEIIDSILTTEEAKDAK